MAEDPRFVLPGEYSHISIGDHQDFTFVTFTATAQGYRWWMRLWDMVTLPYTALKFVATGKAGTHTWRNIKVTEKQNPSGE